MLNEENPIYEKILEFYRKILQIQGSARSQIDIAPVDIRKELMVLQSKEGFPVIDKKDFVIDIPSSVKLFEAVCRIGKTANEKMRGNIQAIEEALAINAISLRQLLKRHSGESHLNRIAEELNIDKGVLNFLIHTSIQPSVDANVEKLKHQVDLKNWLRGYCPVCGSQPLMAEIGAEGRRAYMCSFCGFHWPGERLRCPFCESRDHSKLHYFQEDKKEAYRVDLCDNCMRYIKTVDSRKLDHRPDLVLEDIRTLHLDFLASERGYKREAASIWI